MSYIDELLDVIHKLHENRRSCCYARRRKRACNREVLTAKLSGMELWKCSTYTAILVRIGFTLGRMRQTTRRTPSGTLPCFTFPLSYPPSQP